MKFILAIVSLLFVANSFAQDMSRTETYKDAYKQNSDGTSTYVGGCSLHEDYLDKKFTVESTLIEYFEPGYPLDEIEIMNKLSVMDPKLLSKVMEYISPDGQFGFDDLTLEKIQHKNMAEEFYRFNIGVGGGNGMYLTYMRMPRSYKLVSNTFDRELEYCDKAVWKK